MPLDLDARAAFADSDCFDLLLADLGRIDRDMQAYAAWVGAGRSEAGLPPVRPFSGSDSAAEAASALVEVLLRLTKLRVELSAAPRFGVPTLVSALATGHANQAYAHAVEALRQATEASRAAHGVALSPGEEGAARDRE